MSDLPVDADPTASRQRNCPISTRYRLELRLVVDDEFNERRPAASFGDLCSGDISKPMEIVRRVIAGVVL